MLTDPQKLLIAAAVDGDLPPDQVKAFQRLLAENPEAVRLFNELRADSARLKGLPRRNTPVPVAVAVMTRIAGTSPTPARKPARRPVWVPLALAASVLVAVAATSFLLFSLNRPTADDRADRTKPTTAPTNKTKPSPPVVPDHSQVASKTDTPAVETPNKPGVEVIPAPRQDVVVVEGPKTPEVKDVFASGQVVESKPVTLAEVKLPTLLSALEFDRADVKAQIEKELTREFAFRLDLFSKTPLAALEQFQSVARNAGVNVFADAATAERLKKPAGFTFAVYVENLTAEEWAALLAELTKTVSGQTKPEMVLGAAHFIPATATEQKDVKDLVGVEFGIGKAAVKPAASGNGEPKPISSDTLPKVVSAVKKSDKAAVVLTYLPANFRGGANKSAEVKQFLDKRGERKPGTVPVLVVIR